jgi:ATP-binding cassette subfamily B protein
MWNRQREAEAAREKLALIDDEPVAPNRNPPVVEEPAAGTPAEPPPESPVVRVDAAE